MLSRQGHLSRTLPSHQGRDPGQRRLQGADADPLGRAPDILGHRPHSEERQRGRYVRGKLLHLSQLTIGLTSPLRQMSRLAIELVIILFKLP